MKAGIAADYFQLRKKNGKTKIYIKKRAVTF